jgi:hypothetical protein
VREKMFYGQIPFWARPFRGSFALPSHGFAVFITVLPLLPLSRLVDTL